MNALIIRDLKLATRSPGVWLIGAVFFIIFLTLCVIALGGTLSVLRSLAPALIWLAVIFSCLLSFQGLFQADVENGDLEQLILSGVGPVQITVCKGIVYFFCAYLPLLLAIPLAGIGLSLTPVVMAGLCLSLLFAAPAIVSYGLMTAALLAGRKSGGFLSILITVPFLIPVLIFGVSAVDSYASNGLWGLEFKALLGLSLIGVSIGVPAAGAALRANLE